MPSMLCNDFLTIFTHVSFRAFLNHKGIIEVFDRYGLTQDQRDAVMNDLTEGDEPIFPEIEGVVCNADLSVSA